MDSGARTGRGEGVAIKGMRQRDRKEIMHLLSEGADAPLAPDREARLRLLLAEYVPSTVRLPWPEVQRTGYFVVGTWKLEKALAAVRL